MMSRNLRAVGLTLVLMLGVAGAAAAAPLGGSDAVARQGSFFDQLFARISSVLASSLAAACADCGGVIDPDGATVNGGPMDPSDGVMDQGWIDPNG